VYPRCYAESYIHTDHNCDSNTDIDSDAHSHYFPHSDCYPNSPS
jgi:hypothetical protein